MENWISVTLVFLFFYMFAVWLNFFKQSHKKVQDGVPNELHKPGGEDSDPNDFHTPMEEDRCVIPSIPTVEMDSSPATQLGMDMSFVRECMISDSIFMFLKKEWKGEKETI